MPYIEGDGKKIEVNKEGFLMHPEAWDRPMACLIAKAEERLDELTNDHWAVINFIRDHYNEKKMAPMIRSICKTTGFSLKYIYELFPSGPAKGACKIAGLPKPDGCV